MNLANLGLAGIMSAQNRLQTAGHNINNADTPGYSRQSVLVQTAGSVNIGAGYVGRGSQAVTVQRAYDSFLQRQLIGASTEKESLVAYGHEISQVDNLFSDRTTGVSPALQQFFNGLQAVASSPADPAARQELLGRSSSLVSQLNSANKFLNEQRNNINTQVETVVKQVNSYAERIQDVNRQITLARATGGTDHEPNDLLDQRDQLFSELNELVSVRASEQDGKYNLILGNGQVLLGANRVYPLQTQPANEDPTRVAVAYTVQDNNGNLVNIEMSDHRITGGKLGGLLQYRREALDPVQNELGRLAVGLAMEVNAQHTIGFDLAGSPGENFFSLGSVNVMPSIGNSETISIIYSDVNPLTGQDYRIGFDGVNYTITGIPNGNQHVWDGSTPIVFEGLEFDPAGASPSAGASWLVQPTRNAAGNIALSITDPSKIAAGAGGGSADNENALLLAQLQSKKTLGNGGMNLNEAFSQIVNRVAVLSQQNTTATKAQEKLVQQNYAAQQALSGVNLDEEYVNLDRYQEQFRAASRLIDVSSTLFDTLLGLRQ